MDPEQTGTDSVDDRLTAYFMPPEVATQKPTPKVDAPQEEAPAVAEETTEEVPEVTDDGADDLDVDGTVYRIPKELKAKVSEWKDGHLRREDYTRKTQELADLHAQAKLTAEALQSRQAFDTETSKEREELSRVQADLDRYKQVDWKDLDFETTMRLKMQMDTLKERSSELNKSLGSKAQEFKEKMEGQRKKSVEEGYKFLQKAIPNLNEESLKSARSSAINLGFTEGELENVYDARFVALAWKAAQFDKLQSSKGAAVASVQKAPPVVKPGATQPGQVAERKFRDARDNLKKTGSLDAFERALIAKGFK